EAEGSLGEKLFSLETPEEVQSLLKGQGIDFTLDEISVLREAIVKTVEKGESGELSEEVLEGVAGGWGGPGLPPGPIIFPPTRW
ncbi:MAG: hypothetical protein PHF24_11140, partial [Syntrophomonas sp.]|nr:hypothetical protein [Syntrophomonas sp.]